MKADVYRFAGEIDAPQLIVNTLADRGVGALQGEYANIPQVQRMVLDTIRPELTNSDQVNFADIDHAPPTDWLLDRYEDSTGGISPGQPTIKVVDGQAIVEASERNRAEGLTAKQLQKFYAATGLRPRPPVALSGESSWGGDANKLYARVRLPAEDPLMGSLLHELGHCSTPLVGLIRQVSTDVNGTQYGTNVTWSPVTNGLMYSVDGSEWRGIITEEAVAEGLGTLVNRKLGLVSRRHNEEAEELPAIVAPYMTDDGGFAGAAPAAVALELLAAELDLPSDRFFRMLVDYANAGVHDPAARQEVAAAVYKASRGKLTLAQIEELPYPATREASLALLWAVEDVLDVPDHQRYSDLFVF